MNYQVKIKAFFVFNIQTYKNVSAGGLKLAGGNPVCGSVPLGLLKSRICG